MIETLTSKPTYIHDIINTVTYESHCKYIIEKTYGKTITEVKTTAYSLTDFEINELIDNCCRVYDMYKLPGTETFVTRDEIYEYIKKNVVCYTSIVEYSDKEEYRNNE